MSQAISAQGQALTLKIKFKSENQETFVERYGGDISPGGIFIRSRNPLTIGTKIAFDLALSTGAPLLQGSGTVVWVRPADPRQPGGGTPGMGIRFDQLKEDSRARLNELLAEKTRRERAGQPVGRGPTPIPDATVSADAVVHDRVTVPATPTRDTARNSTDSSVHRVPTPSRGVPTVAGRAPAGFHVAGGMREGFGEPTRQARPAGWNPPGGTSSPTSVPPSSTPSGQGSEFDDKPRTPVFGTKVERGTPRQGGVAGDPLFKAESTRSGSPSQALLDRATPAQGRPVFARRTPPPVPPSVPVGARADFQSQVPTAVPRGSTGGQATDVASGTVKGGRRIGASEWESEKTEIMQEIPAFEFGGGSEGEDVDLEERETSVVTVQVPGAASRVAPVTPENTDAASNAKGAPAFAGLPAHLLPQGAPVPSAALPVVESQAPPEEKTPAFDEPKTVGLRPRHSSAELDNLFEGEELPVSSEISSPLVPAVGSSSDELQPGSRSLVGASLPHGSARVARKGTASGKRVLSFALVGLLIVTGAAVAVEFTMEGGVLGLLGLREPAPVVPAPVVMPAPAAPAPVAPAPVEPTPAATEQIAEAPESAPPVATQPVAAAPSVPDNPASVPVPEVAESARPGTRPASRTPRPAAGEQVMDEVPGWLRVRSVPEGAEVFIDGNKEGTTPFERRVLDITQPHALSVRKSGYESYERLISGSDPWVHRYNEASLTLTVRLRRVLGEPGESEGSAQGTPAAPPGTTAAPEPTAP